VKYSFHRFAYLVSKFAHMSTIQKMPRRPLNKKRILLADPIYGSVSVHMLINRVLKSGKKSVAYRIVYNALKDIGESTGKNPVEVFEKALDNVTPRVEVKPRRRAGAIQLVPRVLRAGDRSKATALRWVLEGCHKRSGQPMLNRLKNEILEAYKKTGYAIRKKDELHKIAVNNAMYARKPQTVINAVNQITL
jgi:small subunit ribosomal protein S7